MDPNEPVYCICSQVSYGEMVGCDNPSCDHGGHLNRNGQKYGCENTKDGELRFIFVFLEIFPRGSKEKRRNDLNDREEAVLRYDWLLS